MRVVDYQVWTVKKSTQDVVYDQYHHLDGVYLLYYPSIYCLDGNRYVYLANLCAVCRSGRKYRHTESRTVRKAGKSIRVCAECRICSISAHDVSHRSDYPALFHPVDDDRPVSAARRTSIWYGYRSWYCGSLYPCGDYRTMCHLIGLRFEILQRAQQTIPY